MCTQELATENCDMKGRKVDLDDYFLPSLIVVFFLQGTLISLLCFKNC